MPRIQTESLAAHRDWRRSQLIDAAAAIALESGGHSITVAAVAQRAGLSRTSVYEYFADQSVTTLSGGQAQRVEIARALIRDSAIYLLDEPLSAQDSKSKDRIIKILRDLRAAGKTILVIAHSEVNSLDWCDQVFDLGS